MGVIRNGRERYRVELVSKYEPIDRWRVWDSEECKYIGGPTEVKSSAEYLADKLNGKDPDMKSENELH